MAARPSYLNQWLEVLSTLLGIVVTADLYSGGQIRRWVERQLAPPRHVRRDHHVYGMATEATRYTREAAEGRK